MKKSSAILIVSAMIFALLLPVSIFAYGDAYISANDPNIKECYIWAEIYRYIRSLCVKKN